MEGQLWPRERQLLHQTVQATAPHISFEIGTWKGGGSTLQILTALTPPAELHTCEVDPYIYAEACHNHQTIEWANCQVTPNGIGYFYCLPGMQVLQSLIQAGKVPDFAFLDGPEDPLCNLIDFQYLESMVRPGCMVVLHDYDMGVRADGNKSIKCQLLRPYIEASKSWRVLDYLTSPVSVGMIVLRKV